MSSTPADCKLCAKIGLRPLTRENVLFYYIPMQSVVSYAALSVNIMNPTLVARLVPKKDITNVLLLHTLFGVTLYIYSRPHLKAITTGKRAAYSLLGGALFSMGSVLLWAIVRSGIPKANCVATAAGLVSGAVILKLGHDYLEDCDKAASNKN